MHQLFYGDCPGEGRIKQNPILCFVNYCAVSLPHAEIFTFTESAQKKRSPGVAPGVKRSSCTVPAERVLCHVGSAALLHARNSHSRACSSCQNAVGNSPTRDAGSRFEFSQYHDTELDDRQNNAAAFVLYLRQVPNQLW